MRDSYSNSIQSHPMHLFEQLRDASQPVSLSSSISQGYGIVLCDSSVTFPFQLTTELLRRASILTRVPQHLRARAVFDYLSEKIEYGTSRRDADRKYSSGLEVWENKQGVCGEMSYLYVSMARFAGLRSGYVQVSNDVNNKSVNHACAYVQNDGTSPKLLVDIAYKMYDVKHIKWTILSDEKVWELFRTWRA